MANVSLFQGGARLQVSILVNDMGLQSMTKNHVNTLLSLNIQNKEYEDFCEIFILNQNG